MADESHDCAEIAKVPGSSASTSSSSDGVISNINSGRQRDIVTGVGRDYMKNVTVAGPLIKDVYVGGDFNFYDVNPSDVRNQTRGFACRFEYTISTHSTVDFVESEATTQALNEVMKALKDDKFTAIGIYGMGGVGKTTLVEHVGAQAEKIGLFDEVIMAVVSQIPNFRQIQGALADGLRLKLKQETETGRASKLKETIMKRNRILIILDNLWKRIELSKVGIPRYDELQRRNSKVIFTTRRLNVCYDMDCQARIPLHILSEEDAWNFFKNKARKSFHESTDFYEVGRKVARECAGLPIELVTVAGALANQDIEEWKAAALRLEMSQTPNPEEDEDHRDMLESIKLSYDYLRGPDAKTFFLLCCLFPEDDDMPIEDLMKYGFGIGLFRDVIDTIANARVRANSVAKHLKESSLLLDGKEEGRVRMHDVIRDTAISIASSEGFLVKAGCELDEWPNIIPDGCSAISLIRNEIFHLPQELVCSRLQILLLQHNSFEEIPETFFQKQQNALRVLDVSDNSISSLPSSLSFLVNLRALFLDRWDDCLVDTVDFSRLGNLTKLEILSMRNLPLMELPKEIGNLANLRMLDVTGGFVTTVPCKVISRLSRLEELYLQCDVGDWSSEDDEAAAQGEEFNFRFDELIGLKYLTILEVIIPRVDFLPKKIGFYPNWVKFNIRLGRTSFDLDLWEAYLFSDDYSRTLNLDRKITSLPAWFVEAVTKKTEKLQYVVGMGLSDIVVEHDHGKLQCLKYLSVIGSTEELKVLMNTTTRVPPNEPVFENLEVLYVYISSLKELCVGELPNGSLRNLKLLKLKECDKMVNAVVASNLLQRLHNLETLICEDMKELEYVFGTEGLVPEQIFLTILRYMILKSLPELINIWDGPAPHAIFRNLNLLSVYGCHELKTLLTSDVAQCLLQLEHLWVERCHGFERVIELPSGETETNKVLVLPKLKGIVLEGLPQLTGFYSSTTGSSNIDHIKCPSLEHLYVKDCPHFSTSASDFHSMKHVQLGDYKHSIPISLRWLSRRSFPRLFVKHQQSLFYINKE